MTRARVLWVALLSVGMLAGTTRAAEIGDRAAPLKISSWIKGKRVNIRKGKGNTIFVIEFWATWCGPCRQMIPHITELQEKYKKDNVVFVGISSEDAATVRPFVKEMGDKMNYIVAVDDDNITSDGYMKAFGKDFYPCAFVVDMEGKVIWADFPGKQEEFLKAIDQAVESSKKMARVQSTPKSKSKQASSKMKHYFELAKEEDKPKSMSTLAKSILKLGGSDAKLMHKFAKTILTDKEIQHRDYKSALKAAKLAYDATDGKDVAIVETYALALFKTGDQKAAVKEQKHAIELCEDAKKKGKLKKTLKKYEKASKDA